MASTYSPSLKIELMGTGDQTGTWGTTTNNNFLYALEEGLLGYINISFASDANKTLTLSDSNAAQDARNLYLYVTSAVSLTATRELIVPTTEKPYIVHNATTGSQSITVKTAAGTGITIPNGKKVLLYANGTNVVSQFDYAESLTLVTPALGTPTSGTLTNCTGLPISTGVSGLGANVATFLATPSSANLAAAVTGETGSGALVFGTSPTLTTPVISSIVNTGTLTLPTSTDTLVGRATTDTLTNKTLTAPVISSIVNTGTLTLPTSTDTLVGRATTDTLTNKTINLSSNTLTATSAQLATAVSDETGSGALVFATSPTLVTPALGTPSSGTLTNCTGLPIVAGTTGTLSVARGGTGVTTSTGSGNVVLSASPQLTGVVTVGGTSIVGLEVGDTTSGVATATAYIDFHTGANIDYDARIVATGGTGSLGDADIDVECATFDITGALSKGSGSFKISHPLPEKTDTHYLVHSFIEGPKADLVYSGMIRLVSGYAHINIDAVSGMTTGTFEVLCRDVRRSTTNESGFAKIRSEFYGSSLHIYAESQDCGDEIFWQVIGERKDPHMYETSWTDEEGHVVVEPKKAIK
jgi:hypothetical protein